MLTALLTNSAGCDIIYSTKIRGRKIMKNGTSRLSLRWAYIALCTVCLAFAGVIYAWSILKVPLAAEFGWSNTELALNFTLTMCTFCIGGFLGSRIAKLIGANLSLILAGLLAGGGFVIASFMSGSIIVLYVPIRTVLPSLSLRISSIVFLILSNTSQIFSPPSG